MHRPTILVLCFVLIVWGRAEDLKTQEAKAKGQKGGLSSQFNDADLDAVLSNPRILVSYVKCFIGEGSCTKEGRDIKQLLPEAIRTECGNCDEKQKRGIAKVLKSLEQQRPDLFDKLMDKYDPMRKENTKKVLAKESQLRTDKRSRQKQPLKKTFFF